MNLTESLATNEVFSSTRYKVKGHCSLEHSVNPPGMHGLPFQDLLPGLLVVLVVDLNDVGHIVHSQVIITPAPAAAQNQTVKPGQESQRIGLCKLARRKSAEDAVYFENCPDSSLSGSMC